MRMLPTHRAPVHPGEMLLEEFLKPLHISQNEFARRIGVSFPRLNEIVNEKRGVTIDTALRCRCSGVPAPERFCRRAAPATSRSR